MAKTSKAEGKAYLYIKEKIVTNQWSVGQQIKELDTALTLEMSRTPVRTALKKLEGEGLVSILPNKGVYVKTKPLTLKEVKERIYFLEALLQHVLYSLQLAETKVEVSELQETVLKMKNSVNSENESFEILEIDFWNQIFKYHSNYYMNDSIIQTIYSLYRYKGSGANVLVSSRPIKYEHYKNILEWITEKNYTYARREVRILLNQLLINLIQGME